MFPALDHGPEMTSPFLDNFPKIFRNQKIERRSQWKKQGYQQSTLLKTTDDHGQTIPGVFDELQSGYARIGWSWQDNLDLRLINEKIQQGNGLGRYEQEAKRCRGFLTRPVMGDYLIYPHQPARRQFCVVQVTGEYDYSAKENGINGDFRSFRPCSLKTPTPVHWYDETVPSQLRQRLGRPGRFSEVYDTGPFFAFLEDLPQAGRQLDGSNRVGVRRIHDKLREILPAALYTEFNRADLSRLLCGDLFERMGYSSDVQEGRAEAGSDVVVTVDSPLLPDGVEFRIGVQVFAYTGPIEASDFRTKLDQLLRGWEDNSLNYGLLLTTGCCSEEVKRIVEEHNKENPNRLVRLIEGDDLADLFLQYFPPES